MTDALTGLKLRVASKTPGLDLEVGYQQVFNLKVVFEAVQNHPELP